MKAIKTQGIITSISSRKDRSLSFRVVTPEVTPSQAAAFFELSDINLDVLLNPLDYSAPDTIKIDTDAGAKSPSARLRNVLFVYWKQNLSDKESNFDSFYTRWMDKKIQEIKDLLN